MPISRGSIADGLFVKWSRRKRSIVAWAGGDPASIASHSLVQKLCRLTSFAGLLPGAGGAPWWVDLACAARSFLAGAGSARERAGEAAAATTAASAAARITTRGRGGA